MRYPIKITNHFLVGPLIKILGCKPETSYAEIDGSDLHIRMGIWFDATIPLAEIASVAPSDWPWWGGLGVKMIKEGVAVVGSTEGITAIRLKSPRHLRILVSVLSSRLLLSLEDRDGFIRALCEASRVEPSPHIPFSL
jgi:hypothetical protein